MHSPQLHPRSGLPDSQAWPPALIRRVDELERTNGHQANFMARLSHELRNPLAPLHHALEVLRLQHPEPSTAQTVELMQRQLAYLSHLVDELLDTERIAHGKLALNTEAVILQRLLDDALALSHPALEQRQHSLDVQVPQPPIEVNADPTRLTQVIVNLLVNAAKYTPARGRIELRVQEIGHRVRVEVSDNGIGLSEDELAQIFDLYAQTASGRRMDAGGLGMGLALARQIVELHGGTLKALSDGPGRGSQFALELPLPRGALRSGTVPPQITTARDESPLNGRGTQAAGSALRILVVDDHVDGADTLTRALQCLGYQAHTCYSGPQALEKADQLRPQVALLDLSMPGMDGYQLAQQLRERHPGVTLVAMTGWAGPSERQRCLQAGFDAHLSKPASLETIDALLQPLQPHQTKAPTGHSPADGLAG